MFHFPLDSHNPNASSPLMNSYTVIDILTGSIVRQGTNRKALARWADKRDLAYGAVRYIVRLA